MSYQTIGNSHGQSLGLAGRAPSLADGPHIVLIKSLRGRQSPNGALAIVHAAKVIT